VRVVVASKFWYYRGGLERVMFDEIAGLEQRGHEVGHFSTTHPENITSPWSKYFVRYLELGGDSGLSRGEKLVAAGRMFYNRPAAQRFAALFDDFKPDIVHVHGIHRQVSPSILRVARARRVPVVQTLHDYHLVCPADVLLRGDGLICDPPLCGKWNLAPCLTHRCVRDNAAASALSALELSWRRHVMRYTSLVTHFIAPSRFAADMAADAVGARPVTVLANAVPVVEHASAPGEQTFGASFLYAGRISHEKGLKTLIEAVHIAGVPLTVAGDGPLVERIRRDAPPSVTFLGRVSPEEVTRLLCQAIAAVVPSEWLENAPLSVLEAMACGRPVIASSVGGIPELVRNDVEGILVPPGVPDALAEALRQLAADSDLAVRMGAAARERARMEFTPEKHVDGLLRIYQSALAKGTP
jgi:glycosyltransferase involved in cell wall biosynthesis